MIDVIGPPQMVYTSFPAVYTIRNKFYHLAKKSDIYPGGKSSRSLECAADAVADDEEDDTLAATADDEDCACCVVAVAAGRDDDSAVPRASELLEALSDALCVPGTRVFVPLRMGTFTLVEILRISFP